MAFNATTWTADGLTKATNSTSTQNYFTAIYHVGILDTDADGAWMSLHGQLEGSTPYQPSLRATAPFDGYIEKIVFRSETATGSTTIDIYKVGDGTDADNISTGTQVGSTITVNMSSAHTAYTFSGGTDFAISEGEVFAFKVNPTNSLNTDAEGVVVVKYLI